MLDLHCEFISSLWQSRARKRNCTIHQPNAPVVNLSRLPFTLAGGKIVFRMCVCVCTRVCVCVFNDILKLPMLLEFKWTLEIQRPSADCVVTEKVFAQFLEPRAHETVLTRPLCKIYGEWQKSISKTILKSFPSLLLFVFFVCLSWSVSFILQAAIHLLEHRRHIGDAGMYLFIYLYYLFIYFYYNWKQLCYYASGL